MTYKYLQIGLYPKNHLPCSYNNIVAVCPNQALDQAVDYYYDSEYVEFMFKDILNYGGMTWAHDRAFHAFYQPPGTVIEYDDPDLDLPKIYYVLSGPNKGVYAVSKGVTVQEMLSTSEEEPIIAMRVSLKFVKDDSPQHAIDILIRVLFGLGVVGLTAKDAWIKEYKNSYNIDPHLSQIEDFNRMYQLRLKEDVDIITKNIRKIGQKIDVNS